MYPLEGRSTALLIATAPHPALHYRGGERHPRHPNRHAAVAKRAPTRAEARSGANA